MQKMYEQQGYYGGGSYRDESGYDGSYNHSNQYQYRNYNQGEKGIKDKVQQKYWTTKQKMIEKFGKEQDAFVISGDAEVDARLEAFRHINTTCMMLMAAIEMYQTRIFGLSQDENEMGRFLKEHGTTDKTKAGKMMIAVGKAQSYAAQQRLSLRVPLVRLYQEVETFRSRAVADTHLTITKMEKARTEYRAKMMWMADVSKELDPDLNKKLDKFREVQLQVKESKRIFDKLKLDVIQKIDLLSASRCNLLSATLEPYQAAMVKFLESTSTSYTQVYSQFSGYPSYQFHILKNIIPNNGIIDDDDEDEKTDKDIKKSSSKRNSKAFTDSLEATEEAKDTLEESELSRDKEASADTDNAGTLINFDSPDTDEAKSVSAPEYKEQLLDTPQPPPAAPSESIIDDLLNLCTQPHSIQSLAPAGASPGFGEFTDEQKEDPEFDDLLGKFEENNILANKPDTCNKIDTSDKPETSKKKDSSKPPRSIDDLLFGSPNASADNTQEEQDDMDILSGILNNQNITTPGGDGNNSFASQWQSMFGEQPSTEPAMETDMRPKHTSAGTPDGATIDIESKLFMPSFLMDQLREVENQNQEMQQLTPKQSMIGESAKTPPLQKKSVAAPKGKDMSPWFDLFADLDPLSNPDAIGDNAAQAGEKLGC